MIVAHIQGALISFFRKILQKNSFFLENVILLRQALVNLRSKLKNKQFFRPNLFGNIYSALNFLAKGLNYVKLFRFKKKSYFQTKYNTKAK